MKIIPEWRVDLVIWHILDLHFYPRKKNDFGILLLFFVNLFASRIGFWMALWNFYFNLSGTKRKRKQPPCVKKIPNFCLVILCETTKNIFLSSPPPLKNISIFINFVQEEIVRCFISTGVKYGGWGNWGFRTPITAYILHRVLGLFVSEANAEKSERFSPKCELGNKYMLFAYDSCPCVIK